MLLPLYSHAEKPHTLRLVKTTGQHEHIRTDITAERPPAGFDRLRITLRQNSRCPALNNYPNPL